MLIRKQTVANMFYPWDKRELLIMLNDFFNNTFIKWNNTFIKAVVCPHAWYVYSWETATYSYKIIKENWNDIKKKTIVLLCPSHYVNFGKVSVWLYDELETPLWNIKVDKKLWKKLINKFPEKFISDLTPHEKEHSLEVQLPFLKFIAWKDNFKVLPLVFWQTNPIEVWSILSGILKEEDIFLIVTSDLSHYENYTEAKQKDQITINNFLSLNTDNIILCSKACWINPWLALNEIARQNNWTPKLINYMNSWDTAWNKDKVVGYASVAYI